MTNSPSRTHNDVTDFRRVDVSLVRISSDFDLARNPNGVNENIKSFSLCFFSINEYKTRYKKRATGACLGVVLS